MLSVKPRLLPNMNTSWDLAKSLIPNGTQTLSKCPDRFVEGVYPKFLDSGSGCHVYDEAGKGYIDYICGLGAILLGYRDRDVNDAVIDTINSGRVLLSLPHAKEYKLAKMLNEELDHAEKVKFFKTGSDATTAAVKVARAYTGKSRIIACGYHGWHDWYTVATDKTAGIPGASATLTNKVPYNDLEAIASQLKLGDVAAIILEPVIYDAPAGSFLGSLISLAHEHGALVIFDEIVTGFRFGMGGAAQYFGASPDIACYSKSLGNGFPIAALVGRSEYMGVFERNDFFISGTFGGELVGISAAIAVMESLSKDGSKKITRIWESGRRLKDGFNNIARDIGLDAVSCTGFAPRTVFNFPSSAHKALFWQECIKRGVLFGYANFITADHGPAVIDFTLEACSDALRILKDRWAAPVDALEGRLPVEVFRLR